MAEEQLLPGVEEMPRTKFSCVLIGAPGTGKSYMAMKTLPEWAYPVWLVDVDNKFDKAYWAGQLITDGKVIHNPVSERLSEGALTDRIKSIQKKGNVLVAPVRKRPLGYEKAVALINEGMDKLESGECKTLVVDSFTRLMEHIERLITSISGEGFMTMNAYGIVKTLNEEVINTITSTNGNVILTCHDKLEKDELSGRITYRPLIPGQFADKIGGYFEEVYSMQPQISRQGTEYQVMTRAISGMQQARTSRNLDTMEPADFKHILEKK